MSNKEKQIDQCKEENELQNSTPAKETEAAVINWPYFLKTITLVLRLYQVMLLRRHRLLTTEEAFKEIESQLDDWVKVP